MLLIHSDDWGRVGVPSPDALVELRSLGFRVGDSPFDFFGLEREEEVLAFAQLLTETRDRNGRPATATLNFVMANADLRAMRQEGYRAFRSVALKDGFPAPWQDQLLPAYLSGVESGAFVPALHGFTHFNPIELMRGLNDTSAYGERVRALTARDIPYLASLTPEFNFALVTRREGEVFRPAEEQAEWIKNGTQLFRESFGFMPKIACAPGYRANEDTHRLWRDAGIEVAHDAPSGAPPRLDGGLMIVPRNVSFEPVIAGSAAVEMALHAAQVAVAQGLPIILSTHSVNYIDRHTQRAAESRGEFRCLLGALLRKFPDICFASDRDLHSAFLGKSPGWLRPPKPSELAARAGAWLRQQRGGPHAAVAS